MASTANADKSTCSSPGTAAHAAQQIPTDQQPAQDDDVLANVHYSMETLHKCRLLPKVELHAHLNGSIRDSTVRELANRQGLANLTDQELHKLTSRGNRSLSECFQLFAVIHRITTSHDTIKRITREVIEDFAKDNVVYLELRSTPKARPEHGMTKKSYVEAILKGLDDCRQDPSIGNSITIKLLLSIDRRETSEAAMETVKLAVSLMSRGVVGIDLSGDPFLGSFEMWEPALSYARQQGLKITLHAGEVDTPKETHAILDFKPDRLGHMCCLTDEALLNRFWDSSIPVELCLTSNIKTISVPAYVDHHFAELHTRGHPVILCTDDMGVFSTSLSEEYAIAAQAFRLSLDDLAQLAEAALEHAFVGDEERAALRVQMREGIAAMRTGVQGQ